jgi:integrase
MKKKLTAQLLNSKMDAGKCYDDNGNGLFISVRKSGVKSWSQKIRFGGKQHELGLGSYPATSLAEARRNSADNKAMTAKGLNPKVERSKPTSIPTFAEVAHDVIKMKQDSLSNAKHKAQWQSTLEVYAFPKIGNSPVNEITVNDIHDLLKPIWKSKTETASRLRGRIETVFDYAIVKQMLPPPNPAVWKGNLSALLPQKSKVAETNPQPALRSEDTQRWWAELKRRDGNGALALQMLTLASSRSGEIRGMHWDEIELFDTTKAQKLGYFGVWICPAKRMKAKREHKVPII